MIGAFAMVANAAGHKRSAGGSGLAQVSTLHGLWGSTAYTALSGSAWGDSITLNNHSNTMEGSGAGYAAHTTLNYTPAIDTILHGDWPSEVAALTGGTFTNLGQGGETSSQIATRLEAVSPTGVNVISFGTNDSIGGVAGQTTLYANIDRVEAHGYSKATTLFTCYDAKDPVPSSYGGVDYARRRGFKTYNWHTGMLKLAHRMNAESAAASLPASWIDGAAPEAFMSSATPGGGLDLTHPGSAFSEAHSTEVASIATAMSGGAPYIKMQTMAVDWSVSAGTLIGTLETIGTVTSTFINNDFGSTGAITLSGANVHRGSGAAPTNDWSEFFIEVRNSSGSNINRLMLGDATGGTTFRPCRPVICSYTIGATTSGTISIVLAQVTSATSRFIKVGNVEVQIRTNGQVLFTGGLTSTITIGANVSTNQHFMITWDATNVYTVLDTTYTDRSSLHSNPNINGAIQLFGATSGTTGLVSDRTSRVQHIYLSDQYFGPGTDLSPIWDGADSAITGPGNVLSGDTPFYSMRGGPGKFASENYGSLGKLNMWPDWDAANARLRG